MWNWLARVARWLFWVLVAILVWRWIRAWVQSPRGPVRRATQPPDVLVQDPMCGTYVPLSRAVQAAGPKENLYFCSQECADRYIRQRHPASRSP
ncbi:MAG: hypothetical protein NZ742_06590 [Acidobacteria bacterium]|nr:hypothetical protein [Acidobacteriota bacterium]MDW7984538.1 hypothetical protein [Acidobacteriota bacterium]